MNSFLALCNAIYSIATKSFIISWTELYEMILMTNISMKVIYILPYIKRNERP